MIKYVIVKVVRESARNCTDGMQVMQVWKQ